MESSMKTHLPSIGMLLLSGGGALSAFTSAVGFFMAGIINYLRGSQGNEALSLFNLALASGLIFLLLLPSTILAAIRLLGKPIPEIHLPWFERAVNVVFFAVPALIGLGYLFNQNAILATWLLPLIQLAVVALPLLWLVKTGMQNLPPASLQHDWGIFSFTTTTTMQVIILLELFLIMGIVIIAVVYLVRFSPETLQQLTTTLERMVNANMDGETTMRALRPYLDQPAIIYAIIAVTAGVIPMIEEFLKPLALWFFAGRLSPRDGFVGGMICGAAFALLESLGALANPQAVEWAFLAAGRVGTGILHITCSGLVGWGMAKAWSEGKYSSLVGAYLAAIGLHAAWNVTALVTGFRELAQFSPMLVEKFDSFIQASPSILVLLALAMVSIIMKANRDLRSE
jgi:hypothetical protein